MRVELLSVLERLIKGHLTYPRAHCRLCKYEHRSDRIINRVHGPVWIDDTQVDHRIDGQIDVVLCDRRSTLNFVRSLSQRDCLHAIDRPRPQEMEPWLEHFAEPAKAFHNDHLLLMYCDDPGVEDCGRYREYDRQHACCVQSICSQPIPT